MHRNGPVPLLELLQIERWRLAQLEFTLVCRKRIPATDGGSDAATQTGGRRQVEIAAVVHLRVVTTMKFARWTMLKGCRRRPSGKPRYGFTLST